jgi:putative pyruvate formate lyase activating enzyme
MIRHLVMPNHLAETKDFVKCVAVHLPKTTYVNILHQYHVDYKAFEYPEIWRAVTVMEYLETMPWAEDYGLKHLDPKILVIREFFRQHKKANGS